MTSAPRDSGPRDPDATTSVPTEWRDDAELAPEALRERLAALEDELEAFRALAVLHEEADAQLERAVRERLPLRLALAPMLPMLARHTGACAVWVRTLDEDLAWRNTVWCEPGHHWSDTSLAHLAERITHRDAPRYVVGDVAGASVVGQRLVVAGEPVGVAAVRIEEPLDEAAQLQVARRLDVWCEALDGFLASMAQSRRKHRVVVEIARCLRDPVLDAGLSQALEVLYREIDFCDLVLAFRHEDDVRGTSLHFKIVRDGLVVHDSAAAQADARVASEALALILGEPTALLEELGIERWREDVLISGVRDRQIIGRIVATSRRGEFSAFDRDLLERFAEDVQLRIVDFNRQWKALSSSFPSPVVRRLLALDDAGEHLLAPREAEVAIVFADIAGFTRLCEQLHAPAAVGQLIDAWSTQVVEAIFDSGGVFDKMIGDCIVGMWGPPFFEMPAAEQCQRALDAARRIRALTRALGHSPAMPPQLAGHALEVAIGLNHCAVVVGRFGPNDDYTSLGSGMNNTARLQGLATGGEVLCMERVCQVLQGHGDTAQRFGEAREVAVKNVAQPLRFRALLDA